jgi:hypothetical protein
MPFGLWSLKFLLWIGQDKVGFCVRQFGTILFWKIFFILRRNLRACDRKMLIINGVRVQETSEQALNKLWTRPEQALNRP